LIAKEIYKTSLDIRIGFLHSATTRAESLNLDLAELFKPIIVDRAIFTVVNKNMLSPALHFEKRDKGVFLNQNGKVKFIGMLYEKLDQTFFFDGEYLSYEALIRKEINKILKTVLEDEKYKPYKYY
jgi:CRISPR-associated endonuclease Cas1